MKKRNQNTTPEDIEKLLKTVQENAVSDRAKALSLFSSLESMIEAEEQHMMFGQQVSSYLNSATRSNDQLMKVVQTKHKMMIANNEKVNGPLDKAQIEKILEDMTPGVLNFSDE